MIRKDKYDINHTVATSIHVHVSCDLVSSVKASITGNHPEISEGGLGDTYILQQFHFHSGLTNARGSEHLLDDGELAGEV